MSEMPKRDMGRKVDLLLDRAAERAMDPKHTDQELNGLMQTAGAFAIAAAIQEIVTVVVELVGVIVASDPDAPPALKAWLASRKA